MRALLVALALLLGGCGGVASTVGAPAPQKVLRGPLALQVLLVDYADAACPFGEAEAWECVRLLNAFTVHNSTGAAWVEARVRRVTLPGAAAAYAGVYDHNAVDARGSRSWCSVGEWSPKTLQQPLMADCRAAAPASRFTLFLLPRSPGVFFGAGRPDWSEGYAWVSCVTAPSALPLGHEWGHMLGLAHADGGVMSGTNPAAQVDAEGWLDPASRALLGWP